MCVCLMNENENNRTIRKSAIVKKFQPRSHWNFLSRSLSLALSLALSLSLSPSLSLSLPLSPSLSLTARIGYSFTIRVESFSSAIRSLNFIIGDISKGVQK